MGKIRLEVGDIVRFTKTFTEADTYLYGGIVGDLSPIHTSEAYCKTTPLGARIVHESLVFSLGNKLSTMLAEKMDSTVLGIGFDDVRVLKPVYFGDTVTGMFTVAVVDETRMRVYSDCVMRDQNGEPVLTCTGIMKVLEP